MKILVDADSCPVAVRETVLRAAARIGLQVVFAANRPIPGIGAAVMELCPPGEGAADDRIAVLAAPGDLALTRDVALAARLVEAGVAAMDDRGRLFTRENIGERLSLRNFMVDLAEKGLRPDRLNIYGKRELKAFADSFDRILNRLIRERTVRDRDSEPA
ncbi:MAG: DUF188 domain-containing protein [Spirochaetaceae bacterium]|jgi:uncharacterized protein YaiI (UPF0178 family)|nr:DUF188 domain-containing protein [Spirochaetaceae bacterium]